MQDPAVVEPLSRRLGISSSNIDISDLVGSDPHLIISPTVTTMTALYTTHTSQIETTDLTSIGLCEHMPRLVS
jgi:hypothetical protein